MIETTSLTPEQIENALSPYCNGPGCQIFPNNVGCDGFADGKFPPCCNPEKKATIARFTTDTLTERLKRPLSDDERAQVEQFVKDRPLRKVPQDKIVELRERNKKSREEREAAEAEFVAKLTPEGEALYQKAMKEFGSHDNFSFAVIRQLSRLRIDSEQTN